MTRRLLTGIVPIIFLGIATETPTLIAQSIGTGSMATGRYGHTATLLKDGRVLIAGGFTDASGETFGTPDAYFGRGITAAAELYDPVTGEFTPIGNMTAARAYHRATLLQDGRVLIASGVGTKDSPHTLVSAELYDPSAGTFTATASMATSNGYYWVNRATLLRDGRVLINEAGGSGGESYLRAELYDPASGTFTATDNPPFPFSTATLLPDGRVLGVSLQNAAIFDPTTGSFAPTGGPITIQYGDQAILLANGKVLVTGGNDDPGPWYGAELYDPSTGTFAETGNMTALRSHFTMTRLSDGKALIAGGSTWNDPVLSRFNYTPGACSSDSFCPLASMELYDPDTGLFTAAGSMSTSRAGHTATLLQSGQVLIVGGISGGDRVAGAVALATAELHTPYQQSRPASWFQVISRNSGKCLDVSGGPSATDPGTPLVQWSCWGGSNQAFLFTPVQGGYQITAKHSGLQLDVTGGPAAVQDGIHVIQWPFWGGSNEIWQVQPVGQGYYRIVALNSGKCLDVSEMSLSDGAPVLQWSCWGGDNQAWQLVPIP